MPIISSEMKPIGVVSEYDLLKAMRQGKDLNRISAEEIMSRPPVTVSLDTEAGEVMGLLEKSHLIRVPAVDHDGCTRSSLRLMIRVFGFSQKAAAIPVAPFSFERGFSFFQDLYRIAMWPVFHFYGILT